MRINPLDNIFCQEQLNRSSSANEIYLDGGDQETQTAPEPGSFFFSAFNGNAVSISNNTTTYVATSSSNGGSNHGNNHVVDQPLYAIPVSKAKSKPSSIQHVTVNPQVSLPTNIRTRPLVASIDNQTNNFTNG